MNLFRRKNQAAAHNEWTQTTRRLEKCPVCGTNLSKLESEAPLLGSRPTRTDTYRCEMAHVFLRSHNRPRPFTVGAEREPSLFWSNLRSILRLLREIVWPYELKRHGPARVLEFPKRATTESAASCTRKASCAEKHEFRN